MFDSRNINAELETGFVAFNNSQIPGRLFARMQVGMLRAIDPVFATAGLGLDIGGIRNAAPGVHMSVMHLVSGFSAQAFFNLALDGTPIFGAGVGWSLIGAEYQVGKSEKFERLLLFKLKIPFGVGMYGIHKMARDVKLQSLNPHSSTDTP
ncbi:MAG: hypothetical protein JXX14_12790 [Deltaproteobacteria bacterium]|nr:hypothetical protein [Deltaproteobacteria bacterium]